MKLLFGALISMRLFEILRDMSAALLIDSSVAKNNQEERSWRLQNREAEGQTVQKSRGELASLRSVLTVL